MQKSHSEVWQFSSVISKAVRLSLCAAVVLTDIACAQFSDGKPNDGVQGLNKEQQELAQRFLAFQDDADEQFFGRADEINSGNESDKKKTVSDEFADFDVRVARGRGLLCENKQSSGATR